MPGSKNLFWYFFGAAMISLALHLPFVHQPPSSQHVWRQATTLSVTDNFFYEGMNILKPRVHQRFNGDGITGMHFPLYEWVLAGAYTIFGNEYWVHRIWSWLLALAGALAMASISLKIWRDVWVTLTAFVIYLFSPEIFYDGWIALPDTLALALVLWGLDRFMVFWINNKSSTLLLSAVLMALGGAVKLQYLGIGFLSLGIVLRDRNRLNIQLALKLSVYATLAVLPPLAWYRYAKRLIDQSGLADVGLELKPAESLERALSILKRNLGSDIPEIILGYVSFAGFIFMLIVFLKQKMWKKHRLFLPFWMFSLGFFIYHLLELRVMEHHHYYMLPYLAVLIPISAKGVVLLSRNKKLVLFLLLTAQIMVCSFRMIPARFTTSNKRIPDAFYNQDSLIQLRSIIPNNALVMAGPDESRTIYLYFLKRYGWGFGKETQLIEKNEEGNTYIQEAIDGGCEYLIIPEELNNAELKPYLKNKIGVVNGMVVYRLYP